MKVKPKFIVNNAEIKVAADELLFDLIYIIVITKITEVLFAGSNISVQLVISSLIIFGALVWVWLLRVNHLNRIHLLQLKLGTSQFKSEWLTYLEIVLLVSALYTVQVFDMNSVLKIIIVAVFVSILSITRVRHKIMSDDDTHQKFHQEYEPNFRGRDQIEINVAYVFERFIIIFVLFLGEILSAAFITGESTANIFLITVLVVSMFNTNVKILNASKSRLKIEPDHKIYHGTINYAKSLLVLLLVMLISIEAAHEIVFATIITFVVLVIYFLFEQQMKNIMKVKTSSLVMILNFGLIMVLVLGFPIPDTSKFILGIITFILNMFYTK